MKKGPIHRWYCIAEMFPSELVRKLISNTRGPILDPFAGVGTVLVEAKLLGLRATGVDVNPFMCFASSVKTRTYDSVGVEYALNEVLSECKTISVDPESLPASNLTKYYNWRTLRRLLTLRQGILGLRQREAKDLLMLCFSDVAVRAANVKKSPAPRLTETKGVLPVFEMFRRKVGDVIEDVRRFARFDSHVDVFWGDSQDLSFLQDSYDIVLTSPPYCNNVDYVRHTQLELYWLGFACQSKDLGEMRRKSLTSCEAMAHIGKNSSCCEGDVLRLTQELQRHTDRAFPRTVAQYFAGMQSHLAGIRNLMKPKSRALYVIGDSWIKGVYVPTHKLIAEIAESVGFRNVRLQFLRTRNSPRRHQFNLSEYLLAMSP